jgi:cobalt-zinc-cadmium resistance protein CzcA
MSLGGLAIGIGKMANSSIIIVENIYRKLLANNKKPEAERETVLRICYDATRETAPVLFSANLIIFMVFVPMFFLQGLEGKMFAPTAFAVGMALIGSFIGAITIKPVLMSLLIRNLRTERDNPVIRAARAIYTPALHWFLRYRYHTIVIIAILVICIFVFVLPQIGREFMPQMDEGAIMASVQLLPGTSLDETINSGKQIEYLMLDTDKFPEILSVTRETGRAEQSEHAHPVSHSHYLVELVPQSQRTRSSEEIIEALREEFKNIPGIRYIFEQPIQNKLAEMLTGTEGELSLKLFGDDLDVLNRKVHEIYAVLKETEGAADVQIEQTTGVPRLNIILDRNKMARYGIKVDSVSDVIETALNGIEVSDVYIGRRKYSILLRLREEFRDDIDEISNLLIDVPAGHRIPLSDLASIEKSEGPEEIYRENMHRRKVILLNVAGRDVGSFVREVRASLAEQVDLPQGYRFEFGGQFENQQRASRQLLFFSIVIALAVGITLISSFGSLRQSMLLLVNVPIALSGGIIGIWLMGATLNVSSIIGFIALFGISLQNGIILIRTFNDLREEGMSLSDAVIEGSRMRLRPILMTELVIMFGALPLVLGADTGSEIHKPLAIVYVGGFLLALVFSKFIQPALYMILEGLRKGRSKTKDLLAAEKL